MDLTSRGGEGSENLGGNTKSFAMVNAPFPCSPGFTVTYNKVESQTVDLATFTIMDLFSAKSL